MPKTGAEARWRAHIDKFEKSRETVAAFCTRHGLARPTFYQWRRRLAAARPADAASAAPFLPVVITDARPSGASGVEVVLRGERRLRLERGFDAQVLAAAVAALERAAC
jgi:transposase